MASPRELRELSGAALRCRAVLQFGVYKGGSLVTLLAQAFPRSPLFGFDSFVGIPPEASGKHISNRWRPGGWSATSRRRQGVDVAMREVAGRLSRRPGANLTLVRGFYNESLNASIARSVGAAAYIDIDCDTYISAVQALDWAFANHVAVPGTLIGYDDFWVLPCINAKSGLLSDALNALREGVGGEADAHLEITRRHGVQFECVCGPCSGSSRRCGNGWRVYFKVVAVGSASVASGLTMTPDDVKAFLSTPACLAHAHSSRRVVRAAPA